MIIKNIFRSILNLMDHITVLKDYYATRRRAAFLRENSFLVDSKKIVFIVSFSNWIYQVKTEAMLALGLMARGWSVKVINSRRNFRGRWYFRALGIHDFVIWEDVELSDKDRQECVREKEHFLSQPFTFRGVKDWTYRGAKIGPQIISSVSRSEMRGAPDLSDPKIRKQVIDWLPRTLETVRRAQKILDIVHPQMLFVNEANYAHNGPLVDCAIQKGVNIIQFVQPFQDDAFVFKRLTKETRRHNPNSVDRTTLEMIKKMPWGKEEEECLWEELKSRYRGKWFLQSRNQPGVCEKTKETIVRELELDPRKKTAVLFSHILWDANLFYGDDLFEDYGDWFVQSVKAACQNPNVNWIIKLHPANLWKRARDNVVSEYSEVALIKSEIGELPSHVKLLCPDTDISTWSLFEFADYGITVRGTIGMEMSCFGVPVFSAGTGRYSGLGFTIDSNSKEEYLERLAKIHEYGRLTSDQINLAKRHAYTVFHLRPWPMKSFKAVFNYQKKGSHPLDHNLTLKARSLDEIQQNGDLEKWAAWASDPSKGVDYLDL